MLDTYAIVQAQQTLQLADDQYGQFIPRLKRLQETRRRNQQRRTRMIGELRRLAGRRTATVADENTLRERLKALREHDEQAAAVTASPTYRANRHPDTVLYTLRAYQICAPTDPGFVSLIGSDGKAQVGLTVTSSVPDVVDVDGVITETAGIHLRAWKETFDDELRRRAEAAGEPFVPFTERDYLDHVDGKPRYDGVRSFLTARDISLPEGTPDDPPERDTICGIGNRKNLRYQELLAEGEVDAYPSTVTLIDTLRRVGLRTAAISASRNATRVLAAVDVLERFDVVVDGVAAAERDLAGKPDPAIFLEAAARLGVAPERAVVVEDAQSGVAAGQRGGFGLVLGVDRTGHAEDLLRHGAHAVVETLSAVEVLEHAGEGR